eukprot:IDg4016t1
MATVKRMHWILATSDGFDLFTDHHRLIFLFDPLAVVPDLSQTSLRKVLRWAVHLSACNYTCVHIKGTENVWADLLGRWSAPPSSVEIEVQQTKHLDTRPDNLALSDGLWKIRPMRSGFLINLITCTFVCASLLIPAQRSPRLDVNRVYPTQVLFWSTLTADVRTFVRSFDYIEIAPSQTEDKYVLMLRDDHSDYKWFFSFSEGECPFDLKALKVPHHFTLSYSPWINGAVEHLGKKLLRVFRSVCSELRLRPDECPTSPVVSGCARLRPVESYRISLKVEDLRNGLTEDVHVSRLKFYHDPSLDTEAVMAHVVSSETGMPVQRLMRLVESSDGLMVQVAGRVFQNMRIPWNLIPRSMRTCRYCSKSSPPKNTPSE